MSSIQFVVPSKGACKLPICSYVIVTMGGSAVLGLNYLLIAVVEIKPPGQHNPTLSSPGGSEARRLSLPPRIHVGGSYALIMT